MAKKHWFENCASEQYIGQTADLRKSYEAAGAADYFDE